MIIWFCLKFIYVIQMRGPDPCLGSIHKLTSGRESLALDLLEPFRPVADRFVFVFRSGRGLQHGQVSDARISQTGTPLRQGIATDKCDG
ncbi:CRISPR-associated endonuclease Cas1 [Magnetococcales bacterium HHB-1]